MPTNTHTHILNTHTHTHYKHAYTESVTCTPAVFIDTNPTPGERFFCQVCGKNYLRKRHLQRHMRDECIGIPPRFECEFCPSKFRRKYHLVRHLNARHNGQGVPTEPKMDIAEASGSTSFSKEEIDAERVGLDLSAAATSANNFSVEAIMMKKENIDALINDNKFYEDIQKKFGFKISPDLLMKSLNY